MQERETDETQPVKTILGFEKNFVISVKDATYGEIFLTKDEYNILKNPLVNRMTKIKQLGAINKIFFCANHTRFEHSLGTLEITWRMIKQIFRKQPEFFNNYDRETLENFIRVVRYSALLHDIGHGAYSHAFEKIIRQLKPEYNFYDHDFINMYLLKRKINNKQYKKIFDKLDLNEKLKKNKEQLLSHLEAQFNNKEKWLNYLNLILTEDKNEIYEYDYSSNCEEDIKLINLFNELIKGDFGSDRLDYLSRDTGEVGIGYRPNVDELIKGIYVHKIQIKPLKIETYTRGENNFIELYTLGIKKESINAAEFLLTARLYHYNLISYNSENTLITKLMTDELIKKFESKKKTNIEDLIVNGLVEGDNYFENIINIDEIEEKRKNFELIFSISLNTIFNPLYRYFLYLILTNKDKKIDLYKNYINILKKIVKEKLEKNKFLSKIQIQNIIEKLTFVKSVYKPIPCRTITDYAKDSYKKDKHIIIYSPFLIDHSFFIRKAITRNALTQTRVDVYLNNNEKSLGEKEIEIVKRIFKTNNIIMSKEVLEEETVIEIENKRYKINLLGLIDLREKTDIEITYEVLVYLTNENKVWLLDELIKKAEFSNNKTNGDKYSRRKKDEKLYALLELSLKLIPSRYKITKIFEEIKNLLNKKDEHLKKINVIKKYSRRITDNFFVYKHDKRDFYEPEQIDAELQEHLSFTWNWEIYEILLTLDALNIFELGDVPSEGKDWLGKSDIRLIKMSHSVTPYRNRMAVLPYSKSIKDYEISREPYYYPSYVYELINNFLEEYKKKELIKDIKSMSKNSFSPTIQSEGVEGSCNRGENCIR